MPSKITPEALRAARDAFKEKSGITIYLPDEGTLDDFEQGRYDGLCAALTAALSSVEAEAALWVSERDVRWVHENEHIRAIAAEPSKTEKCSFPLYTSPPASDSTAAVTVPDEVRLVLDLMDDKGRRADLIHDARVDSIVEDLCERNGYGAVMDAAARLWFRKDPIGAFVVGPCAATVRSAKASLPASPAAPEGVKT